MAHLAMRANLSVRTPDRRAAGAFPLLAAPRLDRVLQIVVGPIRGTICLGLHRLRGVGEDLDAELRFERLHPARAAASRASNSPINDPISVASSTHTAETRPRRPSCAVVRQPARL